MTSILNPTEFLRVHHHGVAWALRGLLLLMTLAPLIIFSCCDNGYTVGKVVHVRVLMALALPLWLPLVICVPEYRPRLNWLSLAVLSMLAAGTAATVMSTNPAYSFWANLGPNYGLLSIIQYTLLAFMVMSLFRTWEHLKLFLVCHVAGSIPLALVVIGHHQDLVIPFLKNHHNDARSGSTLGFPTYANVHFTFLFAAAVALLMSHRWTAGWRHRLIVILSVVALSAVTLLLWAAAARAGLAVSALVLFVAFVLTVAHVRPWTDAAVRLLVLAAALALALGFVAAMSATGVESRLGERLQVDEGSSSGRRNAMVIGVQAFLEKPVFGWGPERYFTVWPRYATAERIHRAVWVPHSHNRITETAATQGMFGLAALLFLYTVVAVTFVSLWLRSDQEGRARLTVFALIFAAHFGNGMFNRESHIADWAGVVMLSMAYLIARELGPDGAPSIRMSPGPRLRAALDRAARFPLTPVAAALLGAALLAGTLHHSVLITNAVMRNNAEPVLSEAFVDRAVEKVETFEPMGNWLLRRALRQIAREVLLHGTADIIPHEPALRDQVQAALGRDPEDWHVVYISAAFYLLLASEDPAYRPLAEELTQRYLNNLPGTLYGQRLYDFYHRSVVPR